MNYHFTSSLVTHCLEIRGGVRVGEAHPGRRFKEEKVCFCNNNCCRCLHQLLTLERFPFRSGHLTSVPWVLVQKEACPVWFNPERTYFFRCSICHRRASKTCQRIKIGFLKTARQCSSPINEKCRCSKEWSDGKQNSRDVSFLETKIQESVGISNRKWLAHLLSKYRYCIMIHGMTSRGSKLTSIMMLRAGGSFNI